jgi:hypothetical protein
MRALDLSTQFKTLGEPRMKRFLPLAALLLLALASMSFAQTAPAASPSPAASPKPTRAQIRNRIIATEKKLWEAFKNKDGQPFRANLSADHVTINETGVMGKNEIATGIANAPCEVKSYALSDFKITFFNAGTALLTYKAVVDGTCAGTAIPKVWSSSLYVNRGGRWLAASHQETTTK